MERRASFPRAVRGLGVFVPLALLADTAQAVVTPVDALTTTFWGADGVGPDNLWNASGLTGSGPVEGQGHDANFFASTMWFAADQDGGLGGAGAGLPPTVNLQAAVFDLGAPTALAGAWVWNHNQAGNLGRAVDEFEILVSSDANPLTATWSSVGTFSLDPPCGCATEGAQFVPFEADASTRLVRFEFISTQSGSPTEYVGLSEVRFAAPSAAAVSDDFDDGNDTGWARFTPAGAASYSFPAGGYRLQVSATGSGLNPARAAAWHPETAPYGDFYVSVDVVDFDPMKPQAFGLLARQNHAGPGTLDGYALTLSTDGTFALNRVDGEMRTLLDVTSIALDPGREYRLALRVEGSTLRGGVFELPKTKFPVAVVEATDATYASAGTAGMFVFDLSAGGTSGADATFDDFSDMSGTIDYSGPGQDLVWTLSSSPGVVSLFGDAGLWDDLAAGCGSDFSTYVLCGKRDGFSGNYVEFAGIDNDSIYRYPFGQSIGAILSYTSSGNNAYFCGDLLLNPVGGFNEATGYAGIRVNDGSGDRYGWARVTGANCSDPGISLTLHEWAVNKLPGAPILAGHTEGALPDIPDPAAVPVLPPGALPGLAALLAAAGATALRRRGRR